MNKIVALVAVGWLLACGAPDPDAEEFPEEYGVLEQPIYMPVGYGSESSSSTPRCAPPWGGGECQVPDRRDFKVRVIDCGTQDNFMTRGVNSGVEYAIIIANSKGWSMSKVTDSSAQVTVRCSADDQGSPGQTLGFNFDCHDTQHGDLCQFGSAEVVIRLGVMFNMAGFQNADDASRQRLVGNVTSHEMGHVMGLGHWSGGFSALMNYSFPSQPVTGPDPWDSNLVFTAEEKAMLDCYRETSGTSPNC